MRKSFKYRLYPNKNQIELINNQLFEANLIDEIILTIEPKIFGSGHNILTNAKIDRQLKLLDYQKLNDQGTLLLHYKIIK